MSSYEINSTTLAILPINNTLSKIIENDNEFLINKKTTQIIDDSCKFFGSSYLGRFEGTKSLIGINYKAPIIVEETNSLIFFPTSSPRFDNCAWISLNHIKNYIKKDNDSTVIYFKNGTILELKVSYGALENQILRSSRLDSVLRSRKSI